MTIKEHILQVINSHWGIKSVDLAVKVNQHIFPLPIDSTEYLYELNRLVELKEIVRMEYSIPNHNDRIISVIYFPKGTEVL